MIRDHQCDVDRPILTALAVFTGAVERIDDPYPLRDESLGAVAALFRQDRVVRSNTSQFAHDEVVRLAIALALEKQEA